MVVLGGVTRLTNSGLSMVRWEPVSGVMPPSGKAEWESEFAQYRASPEYQKINLGITLDQFKKIFWFEYAHRLLGRLIGVAFALPLLYFWVRGRIHQPLLGKLLVLLVLGGLQGLLGWYMVKSGLVDNPHVSQYRLTAHLGVALAIYAYMLWVALSVLGGDSKATLAQQRPALRPPTFAVLALLVLTILSGGFVAGLDAGFAYNTFPRMGGQWVPEGLFALEPAYLNFFENLVTVQFVHRLLAMLTFVSAVSLWVVALRAPLAASTRAVYHWVALIAVAQVGLGIATLLLHVPVPLAAAHQAGALLLLGALVIAYHHVSQT
jgi:cytochrome c oxidase assembly protein subunit 15